MAKRKGDDNITMSEGVDSEDNMTFGAGDYLLPKPTPRAVLKKPRHMSTWTFSLIILSLSVLFLFGLLAGYYIWGSMNSDKNTTAACSMKINFDSTNNRRIDSIHENIIYYLSGARVLDRVRNLKELQHKKTEDEFDNYLSEKVKEEFKKFGMDGVKIQEEEIVVTYPDPLKPNRLEVLDQSNSVLLNTTLVNADGSNTIKRPIVGKQSDEREYPHVAFSVAADIEGTLLYGHYGRPVDFAVLDNLAVEFRKKILLIRLGKLPVRDKLWLASRRGASGVLLYWDPRDLPSLPASYIPSVSANPGPGDFDSLVSIAAQTISFRTADLLLDSMSGDKVGQHWQDEKSTVLQHSIGNVLSDHLKVKLHIHNKQKAKTIRNVVCNIEGNEQADELLIIGAQRHSSKRQLDAITSTAMMLEIAYSLSHIRYRENWRPRRQIQLVSFGGLRNFSDAGIISFIKSKPQLLKVRTVAYFSLNALASGNYTVQMMSSPAFNDVVMNTASRVVDVHNDGKTLLDSWMDLELNDPFPITEIHDSAFYGNLGIPEFRAQYKSKDLQNVREGRNSPDFNIADEKHHYKYHIMSARMLLLTMLKLTDQNITPFNMQRFTLSLYKTIQRFTGKIFEKESKKIAELKMVSERLLEAGKAFEDVMTRYISPEEARHPSTINRIAMAVNKIFLKKVPFYRSHVNLLEKRNNNTAFTDIISLQTTNKTTKMLDNFVKMVTAALQETIDIINLKS